jgi:hypothetical protein
MQKHFLAEARAKVLDSVEAISVCFENLIKKMYCELKFSYPKQNHPSNTRTSLSDFEKKSFRDELSG